MKSTGAAATHLGNKTEKLDDSFLVDDELGLYLIADGSTHPFGYWASSLVVSTIHNALISNREILTNYRNRPDRTERAKVATLLSHAIEAASRAVLKAVRADPMKLGVVSTVAAVLILEDCAILGHIGNTRVYLIRDQQATQLTKDHTLYTEMVDAGVWSPGHIDVNFKHTLTRSIGTQDIVPVFPRAIPLAVGDRFLICTEGLSDHISSKSSQLVQLTLKKTDPELASALVQFAVGEGSKDNLTVLTLKVEGKEEEKQRIAILKSIPLFRGIAESPNDLIKVSSLLGYREVHAGQEIVRQGEPSNDMLIIQEGKVKVVVRDQTVATIEKNGVIGEIGFFNQSKRTATVVALTPLKLLVISREDLILLMKQDKDLVIQFALGIIEELSKKVRLGSENLADIKMHTNRPS